MGSGHGRSESMAGPEDSPRGRSKKGPKGPKRAAGRAQSALRLGERERELPRERVRPQRARGLMVSGSCAFTSMPGSAQGTPVRMFMRAPERGRKRMSTGIALPRPKSVLAHGQPPHLPAEGRQGCA
jgi:hypothetical protein